MPTLPGKASQNAVDTIELLDTGTPESSWGELTSNAIAAGFDQGLHASDPSGDGHGPGTLDEPRDGLANVVNQSDLRTDCQPALKQ